MEDRFVDLDVKSEKNLRSALMSKRVKEVFEMDREELVKTAYLEGVKKDG